MAEKNGLKLNTKKTQLLLIGRKKRERELAQVRVDGKRGGGKEQMCEVSGSDAG